MKDKVIRSKKEWRAQLTPEEYYVTREKGTERPFTGLYHNSKESGIYCCVCCGQELFGSHEKFDSGTGWPSFWGPVDSTSVAEYDDNSIFLQRIEIRCSKCDGHLGHVFDDGPQPTGLRYCVNSTSLNFQKSPNSEK